MKKSLVFKILYLFLVLIVITGASVFASNTYLASQVTYGNSNVEDALNGLFTLKGNDENYSTDEKIVGKWIDNKPIYRKIFNITISDNTFFSLSSFNISNVENIVTVYGLIPELHKQIPMYLDTGWTTIWINDSGEKLYIKNTNSNFTNKQAYIILQYTKTTDNPTNN